MNIKKFLYILLLSCTILTLTACAKKDERTVIRFSSWGSESEMAILKPILNEFEKENGDIKVELIHIPKNYFQKLQLMIASNLAPDVIFLNNLNGPIYAEGDTLTDLNQLIKDDNLDLQKSFFKESLDALTYKGKFYAIPRDISNLVIFYNKNVFDQYKIPYPKNNWTYDDFLKTAQKLTKDTNNDGKIDIFGFGFEELSLFWTPFLWSNGGGIISSDLKTVEINKPVSIKSLQFYADLRNRYHVAPKKDESASATMSQLFIQGKLAMQINGRWAVPRYRKDLNFKWDIAPFPNGTKGSIVDADASGWAISKSSSHKKEAWRLIRFLSSRKIIAKFSQDGLIVPARIDVAYSDTFLNKNQSPKNSKLFVDIIPHSKPTPANQNYQEILDTLNLALEPVWNGEKSAKQAINKDTTDKIRSLLSE